MIKRLNRKIIHINWDGPFKLSNYYEESKSSYWDESGLYQIYGPHPVYGRNVLLYIGKTSSFNQTLYKRICQHPHLEFYDYPEKLEYYLGIISTDKNINKTKKDLIDIAETLLITAHQPACNSSKLKGILDRFDPNIAICNWESFGCLMPEISVDRYQSYWWTT